jgi:hypothetical protein
VACKSREIPELRVVVDEARLSVSKASRIVSSLTRENASEVIAFALTPTSKEIDEEMTRRNPRQPRRDSNRPIGNDMVEFRAQISTTTNKKLKRAEHGGRCSEDRFLHLHHIVPLSQGGSDDKANLTCL